MPEGLDNADGVGALTLLETDLPESAEAAGAPYRQMPSGAGHDTQVIAPRVPSAMLFVPCKDGVSHDPSEEASPADGALAAEVMLNAIARFLG